MKAHFGSTRLYSITMISNNTLYNLTNTLGALAMLTVVVYHFVAINSRYLSKEAAGRQH